MPGSGTNLAVHSRKPKRTDGLSSCEASHSFTRRPDPAKFYLPAYIGPRGWVGLRLDIGEVDWDEVKELVTGSYLQTAPRKLAALVVTTLPD